MKSKRKKESDTYMVIQFAYEGQKGNKRKRTCPPGKLLVTLDDRGLHLWAGSLKKVNWRQLEKKIIEDIEEADRHGFAEELLIALSWRGTRAVKQEADKVAGMVYADVLRGEAPPRMLGAWTRTQERGLSAREAHRLSGFLGTRPEPSEEGDGLLRAQMQLQEALFDEVNGARPYEERILWEEQAAAACAPPDDLDWQLGDEEAAARRARRG